jgi:hypothetical protein
MSDDISYSVKISGPGLTLDQQVPKAMADRLIVLLLTGQANPSTSSGGGKPAAPASATAHMHSGDAPSLREFLNGIDPKRAPDKITAIGEFLRQHGGKADFKVEDIIQGFEDAAEPVPKNLPRDMKWTTNAAWIAPRSGTKGAYYVTKSGQEAVAQKFSKEVVAKTKGYGSYKAKPKEQGEK